MIFVNTAATAKALAHKLRESGVPCAEFHSLQSPYDKEDSLAAFRAGEIDILLCTDSAARFDTSLLIYFFICKI
jgi:superfamily II DNA/RNA helicase